MTVEAGTYWRLLEPEWVATYGQGDPPGGLTIGRDGETVHVPWGSIVRASDTVDYPGTDARSPIVLHVDVLTSLSEHQIEHTPNE